MSNGLFIVFEGIDGAGKTTQITMLEQWLKQQSITPLLVREPGGTKLGEEVREILLSHKHDGMSGMAELMLFCASRSELVRKVIQPALHENRVVIADRYRLSSQLYQGIGRNLDANTVSNVLDAATDRLLPGLTIILDMDYAELLTRREGTTSDRMEKSGESFFRNVAEQFRLHTGAGVHHIDATLPRDVIAQQIQAWIQTTHWWMQRA